MSAIPCPECGVLRKVEQVVSSDGWHNPPCRNCGDPGWTNPLDADDPLAGRPERLEGVCGLVQDSCICTRPPGHPDDYHECSHPGCGGQWRIVDGEPVPVRFPYAGGAGPATDALFGLTPTPYHPETP